MNELNSEKVQVFPDYFLRWLISKKLGNGETQMATLAISVAVFTVYGIREMVGLGHNNVEI